MTTNRDRRRRRGRGPTASRGNPRPHRSCGACSVCCYVLNIHARRIGTVEHERCRHQLTPTEARASAGSCRIHQSRPACCRNFECIWLQDGPRNPRIFGEDQRPDRIGIMLQPDERGISVQAHEARPGASATSKARKVINEILAGGFCVIIVRGPTEERSLLRPH